jgi:hypothetical protein
MGLAGAVLTAEQLVGWSAGMDSLERRERVADRRAGIDRTAPQRRADLFAALPAMVLAGTAQDAGAQDAGAQDAAAQDTGAQDAGAQDAATRDAAAQADPAPEAGAQRPAPSAPPEPTPTPTPTPWAPALTTPVAGRAGGRGRWARS